MKITLQGLALKDFSHFTLYTDHVPTHFEVCSSYQNTASQDYKSIHNENNRSDKWTDLCINLSHQRHRQDLKDTKQKNANLH